MSKIVLTSDPLDRTEIVSSVTTAEHGAVVTFEGVVRNLSRGENVSHLDYQAYAPLAQVELERIIGEAATKWKVKCAIGHRVGRVDAGECSVIVAVSSPHRGDSFEACRWLMDALKSRVPIWKKEFTENGAHWIEGSNAIPSTSSQK